MRSLCRIIRWSGIAVAVTAGMASLLLLIAYGFLQSDSGRARIVEILNWHLSTPGVSEIRIGRLDGNLLERIEIHDLRVSDRDGTWLRLKLAGASWQPGLLLVGTLGISNLDIEGLTVLRQPRQTETSGEFNWPELPLAISVENFLLSDAVLEQPVFGEKVIFRASGDTQIEGADRVRTTIEITRTDGVSAAAQLQATLQPRSNFLRFQLALNEAEGGVIARAIDLDNLPSLSIQATGEGPLDQLQGKVLASAGDLASIESNFSIASGDRTIVKLDGTARLARLVDEPLRQLLTSEVTFDLHADLIDDGIRLHRGLFTNDLARIEVSGELRDLVADFDFSLEAYDLKPLSPIVGMPLGGSVAIKGEIGGDLANPALTAHMVSPDLSIDGFIPGATEARVNIAHFSSVISGNIELAITNQRFGPARLTSKFVANSEDSLRFDELMVESRNTRLSGALSVDLSDAMMTGKMSGEEIALAPWSDLADRALSGVASLSLDLSQRDNTQWLDLAVVATGLNLEVDRQQPLQVGSINISARIKDLFGTPVGGMRLVATDTRFSDARFTQIAFEAKMDTGQLLQGRLETQGEWHGPFELEMSADYRAQNRGFVLTVSEFDASLSGQTIELAKPLQLEHDNGMTSLAKSTLLVAGGSLTANGEVGSDHLEARLQVEGISIAALHTIIPTANLSGTLAGHAQVSGSRVAPIGELDLRIVDVRSTYSKLDRAAPVSGQLRGEWRDARLKLSASFSGATESSVEVLANTPLRLEPETLVLTMPANEAIDGKLNWSGDLGPVWDLFSPYEDRFTGPGEIALAVTGNLDSPAISGYFEVLGGHYENLQSATTLVDVNLRLAGDGDSFVLEALNAGDGQSGSLQGTGLIEINPAQSYPIHMNLAFNDMRLIARDDVRLNASGNLTLEGTLASALLSGAIVTGQSELSLAGTLPPSVVELEVDEINVDSAKHAIPVPPAGTKQSSTIALELEITVPGRAFVRGLGLESEWKGDLNISGPTNAPKLVGVLNPVRGRFFLMGKTFKLEHGAIRFTGSEDIDPLLDLTAEHRAASLTALVRVTGSASKPSIVLTSRPPLPESEIASQVLFGTGSGNLTTAQSLQLASAVATYSGTGGAIGILDATRRALGVDVITFSESEENPDSTRVGVGKYIAEGVYIEIEGGGERDSQASTTIEVEVLPNVRFEGGTTETGGNKVGVKWKWDY